MQIKELTKKALKKTIQYLSHFLNLLESEINGNNNYHTLAPTDDAENVDTYIQSLDWALKNKHRIKNIAISGAYGSGKSSVIKTFIKRNKNIHYKFLNISLATFKEQNGQPNALPQKDNDILRLIELSVLQQLFYHETDGKIPDSRLRKIKSHKKPILFCYSIGLLIFLISILYLLTPNFLSKFHLIEISKNWVSFTHYTATSITLLGLLFIVYKSSRALKSLAIKKLKINNAEIEIDNRISKSILNNHIDEILYFFEVTDYNVVIIEDLDRFEKTEVFTKLREINLLINNSKKVQNEVVFIYAIKDDMFLDKDRTKFFDFMIPIIPVINSSNSNEKLLDIVKRNDYKIRTELIDDLSLFIDDMRLLYNIMNEYYIYSKNLASELDQEKLLSMIVYKNVYPNDFTQLSESKGDLFETISKKSIYIKSKTLAIDKQIEEIKRQITEAEKSKLSDIKELRLIYVSKILEQIITTKNHLFKQFWIEDKAYNISSMVEDENFSKLLNGSIAYQYENHPTYRTTFTFKFETIENSVNPYLSYKKREELVLNNARLDILKKQLSELENSKIEIRKSKLSNLISDELISISQKSDKQSELINLLLRNGYIDENYWDYISIFYEGSLSKSDYQFLINVKIQKPSEFDYKLTKIEKLIGKINLFDFEKEYILNFDLVEFLQQESSDNEKKKRLFKQLSNQSPNSIKFIDRFLETTTSINVFIQILCEYWQNIWTYIETESLFDDAKKNNYFILIIKYAKVEDIKSIFSSNYNILNRRADFLSITDDEKKLKEIIKKLNLKFESINSDSPVSLIDYVYKGNYYDINRDVIEMLLKHFKRFDINKFSTANFSSIMTSSLDSMINYIGANLEDYVNSVYLKIERNTEEPIEYYLRLLNNETLDKDSKENLIIQVDTKITDIKAVSDTTLWNTLFGYSKISPTWNNILASFEGEENRLNEDLLDFLNTTSNSELLSNADNSDITGDLGLALINENKINDVCYNLLTKSIQWWYSDIEFGNISRNRTIILIKNKVVEPTIESFRNLKENHNGLNIQLLEEFPENYINKIEQLELDSYDLQLIFESQLSNYHKKILFENCDPDIINSNSKVLLHLSYILEQNIDFKLDNSTKREILLSTDIPKDKRIELFVQDLVTIDSELINSFIPTLGNDYYEINDFDKKAKLEDTLLNRKFLEKLISAQFISSYSEKNQKLRVNHKRH